ncbi:DNA ligase/mRNA capping enzyme [Thozetella sp. PMI_491]|nr:DNA ligase/mRNA capping enzyme [Thozetella sp. PMI_491]
MAQPQEDSHESALKQPLTAPKFTVVQMQSISDWLSQGGHIAPPRNSGPSTSDSSSSLIHMPKTQVEEQGDTEIAITNQPTEAEPRKTTNPIADATQEASNPFIVQNSSYGTQRKLLTVRRIRGVYPVALQNMQAAEVDGQTVLVPRSAHFRDGEFVLFLELGTFVPKGDPRFDVLQAMNYGLGKYDGQAGYLLVPRFVVPYDELQEVSEGCAFKLKHFPDIKAEVDTLRRQNQQEYGDLATLLAKLRGIDYSSQFKILEMQANKDTSRNIGKLPFFIRSTDSKRLGECPNLFIKQKYENQVYQESVKMDGQSMTAYFVSKKSPFFRFLLPLPEQYDSRAVRPHGRFGVCSKNTELNNVYPNAYWDRAIAEGLHEKLSGLGKSIAVMGELVGPPVGSGRAALVAGETAFYVFSVFDIDDQTPWNPKRVEEFAKDLGLRHVEVRGYATLRDVAACHKDIQNRADMTKGEGLVYKNTFDGRWFKVLSQPYLARKDKEPASDASSESRVPSDEDLRRGARIWREAHGEDMSAMHRLWEKETWEDQAREFCTMWAEALVAEWERQRGNESCAESAASA